MQVNNLSGKYLYINVTFPNKKGDAIASPLPNILKLIFLIK